MNVYKLPTLSLYNILTYIDIYIYKYIHKYLYTRNYLVDAQRLMTTNNSIFDI